MRILILTRALAWPIATVFWLAIIFNFLVINRYAYQATQLIKYTGVVAAIIVFTLAIKYIVKGIKSTHSKDYMDFILLLLMPPGMALVAFVTLYAIGATATQAVSILKADKELLITITDKNIKDYVPAGGCRYTIDIYLRDNETKINNHCVNLHVFDNLSRYETYLSRGIESIFGVIIYEIDDKAIKTAPSLRKY
jgi:hypothetical protein